MSIKLPQPVPPGKNRRDILYVGAAAFGAVGASAAVWPLIDNLNPSASVLEAATTEIALAPIEPGQRVTVMWRGKPVFIDYRTAGQIVVAEADDSADLRDPEADGARVIRPEWLIVVGVCTHLGCVPLGQHSGDPLGDWGGWFCPCHGSHYDTSGRVRKGPAPKNLEVPPYRFTENNTIVIG